MNMKSVNKKLPVFNEIKDRIVSTFNDFKKSEDNTKSISKALNKPGEFNWDKYNIKVKKKNLPTALKETYYKNKYAEFFSKKSLSKTVQNKQTIVAPNQDVEENLYDRSASQFKKSKVKLGNSVYTPYTSRISGSVGAYAMGNNGPGGDNPGIGGGPVGPSVDVGGFGVGDFGMTAFGEAVNRNMKMTTAFIDELDSNDATKQALKDAYAYLFTSMIEASNAVMFGIQPSMAECIKFDLNLLVNAINNFEGTLISIYIGDGNDCETEHIIKEWYSHIGISDAAIENIIFIEKNNIPINDNTMLDVTHGDSTATNSLDSFEEIEQFVDMLQDPKLFGCADTYMMGEFMYAFEKNEKRFEIDKRYLFLI